MRALGPKWLGLQLHARAGRRPGMMRRAVRSLGPGRQARPRLLRAVRLGPADMRAVGRCRRPDSLDQTPEDCGSTRSERNRRSLLSLLCGARSPGPRGQRCRCVLARRLHSGGCGRQGMRQGGPALRRSHLQEGLRTCLQWRAWWRSVIVRGAHAAFHRRLAYIRLQELWLWQLRL